VRDLVSTASVVVDHIVYATSGVVAYESSTSVHHFSGFAGYHDDVFTGVDDADHRWYDPAVIRWESEDPLGFVAGDPNVSRYVGNGTTDALDPTGLADKAPKPKPGATAADAEPLGGGDKPENQWYITANGYIAFYDPETGFTFVIKPISVTRPKPLGGGASTGTAVGYILDGDGNVVAQFGVTGPPKPSGNIPIGIISIPKPPENGAKPGPVTISPPDTNKPGDPQTIGVSAELETAIGNLGVELGTEVGGNDGGGVKPINGAEISVGVSIPLPSGGSSAAAQEAQNQMYQMLKMTYDFLIKTQKEIQAK